MKYAAVLLGFFAACSAQLTAIPYTGLTPFTYPYAYNGYPYAYGAYAPMTMMKSMVAAPTIIAAAPALVKSQYHAQDPFTGMASYGHMEAGQAHSAIQDAAGNKVGSFSHMLPDGSISRTDYVADALGYRVASNALPINTGAVPEQVVDTPEVVAARAAHIAEVEKVKSRSKRAVAITAPAYTATAYAATPLATPIAYSSPYNHAYYTPSAYYGTPATAYSHLPYYY